MKADGEVVLEFELKQRLGICRPYTNHVAIEQSPRGTYRCDGVSNAAAGEPVRFASPHFNDLEAAKLAAVEWAKENGVTRIFLPPAS